MTEELQVPGSEGGVSTPETPVTPVSEVTATPVTVTPNPVDVDALKAKYEQDINNLKSTLQRREAQVTKEWQTRYNDLQRQVHESRMASMNEEDRAKYERQLENEEFQSLQSRLAELEQEKAQQAATVNAFGFFTSQGVPADKLNLAEGYDALVNAGWGYLTQELSRLREAAANPQPQKPVEPAPLKQAPDVITDKGTPASGSTWTMLRQQFGSDENIYRAIEEGRLSPSVLPK